MAGVGFGFGVVVPDEQQQPYMVHISASRHHRQTLWATTIITTAMPLPG
jgi:hypothetical protein